MPTGITSCGQFGSGSGASIIDSGGENRDSGQRLHQNIVSELQSRIRAGQLPHGARLPSERALAGQFKVGRGSIREAIRSLERQGLVQTRPGAGSFVNTQSLDAVTTLLSSAEDGGADGLQDIFEMRRLLEPQIAALAALRATPGDLRRLHGILREQQRQILEGETGVHADTEFHFALATATHNAALVKVVNAVEDVLLRSRDRYLQERGRPERSLQSHRRILEMVQAGDAAESRRAMEHHLTVVEPAVVESALAEPPPAGENPAPAATRRP